MDSIKPKQIVSLTLLPEHREQLLVDIEERKPEEACGLIAGISGKALCIIPITNQYHSRVRYRMAPEEQLEAFNYFDLRGWELLAIYHSHPEGPDFPSATDIAEATYPGIIYLIWFPRQREWDCRGFLIEDGLVTEVMVSIADIREQTEDSQGRGE